MARVSVILPVYNGASTIARALGSVFAQTFTDYEIVVVDDGDDASTEAVIAGVDDSRVPIRLERQHRLGAARARNRGATLATGDFLLFC
ncbi:MAG TPA: glycosyltransferase family A protein, partial [Methylomirabilota bacterium]|nr:glycosyltransferase family A protein [Methylomirabilota bacterium]